LISTIFFKLSFRGCHLAKTLRDKTGFEKFNFCAIIIEKRDTYAQIKGEKFMFISNDLIPFHHQFTTRAHKSYAANRIY